MAHDAKLLRSTSQAFFASNLDDFDIIFVDGDHRYQGCRDDCEAALAHIRPGGLLIIDDYGNSFHPEVELAVRRFADKHAGRIAQAGWHPLFQTRWHDCAGDARIHVLPDRQTQAPLNLNRRFFAAP